MLQVHLNYNDILRNEIAASVTQFAIITVQRKVYPSQLIPKLICGLRF